MLFSVAVTLRWTRSNRCTRSHTCIRVYTITRMYTFIEVVSARRVFIYTHVCTHAHAHMCLHLDGGVEDLLELKYKGESEGVV